MDKISNAQAGEMMKMASAKIRAQKTQIDDLTETNSELMGKVAHYAKKEQAERIATQMEEKQLQPELSFQEKVANLMRRDDLSVVEEAVGLSTPQMKLASVASDSESVGDGESAGSSAENAFAQGLLTDD